MDVITRKQSQLIVIAICLLLLALICRRWARKHDLREPNIVAPRIPLIGHALGLLRKGISYYPSLSSNYPDLPIFTVDLFGNKTYIINSPTLVSAVQRNNRNISFDPFLTSAAERLAGIKGHDLDLLREQESGGHGVHKHVLHDMHPALLGDSLDRMNEKMINYLRVAVDDIASRPNSVFDLHLWCRHAITVASTDAVYGPLNPYKDREVEVAFWKFSTNVVLLLVNVAPHIIARKAWKAREILVAAFVRYYNANGHEDSSELTYRRWKAQFEAGISTEGIARLEAAAGTGILSNTVPSSFWMLFDVYSRPSLLDEIRNEVRQNALHIDKETGTHLIDLGAIRDGCPILLSAFQEMLRLRSNGAASRIIYKDMMLDDKYLLRGNSMLQIPASIINRHRSAWGEESRTFDPYRFVKTSEKDSKRKAGFLSFGAPPNVCPGRHFASGEILSLVAMMVLRLDISPEDGQWVAPELQSGSIVEAITPPVDGFKVKISVRKEYEGKEWAFRVTPGKWRYGLVVG